MIRRLLATVLLSTSLAFAEQPIVPDSPAGHALSAYLDAFNSGDRAKIEAYIQKYDPKETVDGMMGFRSATGGFELLSIESSQPLLIKFHVRNRNDPTVGLGSIRIKDAESGQVANLQLRAIPPGTKEEDITLDAARRKSVIEGAIWQLKEYYIYPDGAQKMADAVLARQKAGAYDNITDGGSFASLLTDDMQAVTHDRHLHVEYLPFRMAEEHSEGPSPEGRSALPQRSGT